MKISYMLKREDFYDINEHTLKNVYHNSKKEKRLYIYPELNAIVVARPTRAVRKYLYTEFRVNGSFLRRLLIRMYVGVLLNSYGLLSTKSIKLNTDADKNTLIYPCNKKYRIFSFDKGHVRVVAKDGFPKDGLINEIAFRTQNAGDFIPGLISNDESGYVEWIIDGLPVARAGTRTDELANRAFSVWSEYIAPYTKKITASDWAITLQSEIANQLERVEALGKNINKGSLQAAFKRLMHVLCNSGEDVPVSLSHGDLQPGNIWVENNTDKLYIIDWESCTRRSVWYDQATLFEGLRREDGLRRYVGNHSLIHATVLLEDIIFRMAELVSLPYDYGCKEFDDYISVLLGGNEDV